VTIQICNWLEIHELQEDWEQEWEQQEWEQFVISTSTTAHMKVNACECTNANNDLAKMKENQ
jgi:hypothetical protein